MMYSKKGIEINKLAARVHTVVEESKEEPVAIIGKNNKPVAYVVSAEDFSEALAWVKERMKEIQD